MWVPLFLLAEDGKQSSEAQNFQQLTRYMTAKSGRAKQANATKTVNSIPISVSIINISHLIVSKDTNF
ncbi:MAG: hypothetical protein IJ816_04450 [Alloprevotella sp.]|nr:hypothetical protein [Alloprevotella sp.]